MTGKARGMIDGSGLLTRSRARCHIPTSLDLARLGGVEELAGFGMLSAAFECLSSRLLVLAVSPAIIHVSTRDTSFRAIVELLTYPHSR